LVVVMLLVGSVAGVVSNPASASYVGVAGRVAYTESREVYVMNADGSGVRRVSSDGGTYIKTVQGCDHLVDVYTGSHSPTWSPDGQQLAFLFHTASDRFEVRAVDPDGGNLRVLFRNWQGTMFSWAPDGERIAYANVHGVWVADTDGSGAMLVAEPTIGLGPGGPDEPAAIESVKWSPDGTRLAFVEHSPGDHAVCVGGSDSVSTINVDGSNRQWNVCGNMVAGVSIDWAPDGQTLACDTPVGGDYVITVEPDGSNLTQLAQGGSPAWSPDGTRILYALGHVWERERELRSYDLDSGTTKRILSEFRGQGLDWQPRQGTFWDDEGSVFIADIEWMAVEGITKGCNPPVNDRFCPYSVVTRGQMAAFLVRALDLTDSLDDPFGDDDESIFESDIERLAAAGITRGCNPPTNDRFCPEGKVTRGQMAAFLVRALDYTDNGGGNLFVDDDDSIFEGDIDRLGTAGVTKGCNPPTNNRYCPTGNVTRGQMAAFLHRALG
jgi:Tol biopolymer transport system component